MRTEPVERPIPRSRRSARVAALGVALLLGCHRSSASAGWQGRRAQHGDTVDVLSTFPVLDAGDSTLVVGPATVLWTSDSLVRPTQIEREPSGVLDVVDGWRVFRISPRGALLRVIGRKGAGPGEFGRISGMRFVAPDTLLLFDGALRRLSELDTNGRALAVAAITPPDRYSSPRSSRVTAWGASLLLPWAADMVSPDGVADSLLITVHPPAGAAPTPLASLPDIRWKMFDGILAPAAAYDASAIYAFGRANIVAITDGVEPCIVVYRVRKPVQRACRTWERGRVTAAERSAAPLGATDASDAQRKFLKAIIENQVYPVRRSSIAALRVAENGTVWARMIDSVRVHPMLRQFQALRPVADRWSVFASDGRWVADVFIPSDFTPMLVDTDAMYGVVENEDGVPSVAVAATPVALARLN